MDSSSIAFVKSPIGSLRITGTARGISSIEFAKRQGNPGKHLPAYMKKCVRELSAYFEGRGTAFSVPLDPGGTAFQRKIWEATAAIPFGNRTTYSFLASAAGHPRAVRAVGTALGKNPLAILIPCHRIVPASGKTGGFAWGTMKKKWLLDHEKQKILPKIEQKSVS